MLVKTMSLLHPNLYLMINTFLLAFVPLVDDLAFHIEIKHNENDKITQSQEGRKTQALTCDCFCFGGKNKKLSVEYYTHTNIYAVNPKQKFGSNLERLFVPRFSFDNKRPPYSLTANFPTHFWLRVNEKIRRKKREDIL